MGCSVRSGHSAGSHPSDVFNAKARFWQYRDLDSTLYYATRAYEEAAHYIHGRTMACNMLGFVSFMRMDYDDALHWYEQVGKKSGCELERLVADVGRMNVYQRMADNLAFYNCRVQAMKRLAHINEESASFSPAEKERLQFVVNDFHMISALHHYMIGQRPEAHAEMRLVVDDDALRADSAQWLMYTYIKGMGLDVEGDTREQRRLRRYTHLNNCLRTSRSGGYSYFEGLASSGISELLVDSSRMAFIAQQRPNSFAYMVDSIVPADCRLDGIDADKPIGISMSFARHALQCLGAYGDQYGVMNATVQIASLYNRIGEYEVVLRILDTVDGAPDPLARRHEEMSVAYAGMGDKAASDFHRNQYLDLLENTRQDKEMESRYLSLQHRSRTMKVLLYVVVVGIVLFVVLLTVLIKRRHRRGNGYEQRLRDLLQETEKRVYLHQKHIEEGKRDNIVRKASFSMVSGMMPYIDRMAHEVDRLQSPDVWEDKAMLARKLDYITELADEINGLNELLSLWIKTTQGMVGLTIESFALSEVFDMVKRGASSFSMKGLTLDVVSTDAVVKADKALTFFMLNTLADNARKFTPTGGKVTICAEVYDEYVELSVVDTGVGMSAEDVDCVLREKVYNASTLGKTLSADWRDKKGGGFGLLNCKGIIDKYRKTDTFFEVCRFGISSELGKGSRFWFRLPKGVRRMFAILFVVMSAPFCSFLVDGAGAALYASSPSSGVEVQEMMPDSLEENSPSDREEGLPSIAVADSTYSPLLDKASTFADSVYYANVDGRYTEALIFADSAIRYLNTHHRIYAAEFIDTLSAMTGDPDVEIRWWLSDYATDYHTILDVRNELAVANLALSRLDEYRYNNRIYNDLYKLVSEDRSLIDYSRRMQRYYSNTSVAVLICLILVVGYLIVIVNAFMGRVEDVYRDIESVENDERRARYEANRLHVQNMVIDNCLSTLKHETVYYPNRIKQIVGRLDSREDCRQIQELIAYYRVTFATLAGCASRQLDEITFRRSTVPVEMLLRRAADYHAKRCTASPGAPALTCGRSDAFVSCDETLAAFLVEQLIDASFALSPTDKLHLEAVADGDFIRISLLNTSRTFTPEALHTLFYPSPSRIVNEDGHLRGTEYIVCRQIIREHDDYFNHIGCRIKAESLAEGYSIWFTLPRSSRPQSADSSGDMS